MMADIEETVRGDPLFHPSLQLQRRSCLGLEDPKMKQILSKTKFVSLGSFCGVAQALQSLDLRGAAGPFDWMRSRCEGVTQLLATNFQDFMTMEAPITQACGSRVLPMAWGGSYWHHDIRDKEFHCGWQMQQTMERRKERFLTMSDENIVFIRSVNCTDELRAIPNLFHALKARFPRSRVRLLVLVDYQDYLSEAVISELGGDVVFSLVSGRVWEAPIPMPEWDPLYMRKRMELEANAYAVSIAKAMRIWSGVGNFSLWPSLECYRQWVSPFTGPDPKLDGFRGRRLPRPRPAFQQISNPGEALFKVPAAYSRPLQATVNPLSTVPLKASSAAPPCRRPDPPRARRVPLRLRVKWKRAATVICSQCV